MKNKFELGFVEKLVFSNYKIRSKAIQVNGEIDDNFKLVSKNNIFFLKSILKIPIKSLLNFRLIFFIHLKKNKKTY